MTIDEILELMDDLLDKSMGVPFSNRKSLVDLDKMREYIDSVRYNLPTEIKKAKEMVQDRALILSEANQKAENIVKRAEERAKILVSNDEITKQAKDKASEIITQAKTMDKEISNALNERIDAMLSEAEHTLCKSVNEIKNTRTAIKSAQKKG